MLNYQEIFSLVEEKLKQMDYNSEPSELYDPIKYILSLGGKRLRPCLAIMAHNIFCDEIDNIIYPAIGIEVFHNFTLLHDDIMDKALLRRNNSTVHVKWNENVAILSGDAMMIMAFELISKTDKECLNRVISIFTKTARQVCEGQQFDMNFENQQNVSIDQYIRMINLKTAVLIAASLAIGAITGKAAEREIDLMYNFGTNIGIAFQLQDDYLDVYADSKKFGKKVGGDILSNKKTYLLISALQSGNTKLVEELNFWIINQKHNTSDKIDAVTAIYNKLDLGNRTQQLANTFFEKGIKYLEHVNIEKSRKDILQDIVSDIMKREK
jgi:geranylgeranyl diphosphate synthase, type II